MRLVCIVTAAALAAMVFPAQAPAQQTALDLVLERSVGREGDVIAGALTSALPVPQVLVTWSDPFGGIWFSTSLAPRGSEAVQFSFQALGCVTPVSFVQAATAKDASVVPFTIFPRQDDSWNSFLIIADRPPLPSAPSAVACRRLGIRAAMANGYLEALSASRAGLRPLVRTLSSGGLLSVPSETIASSIAEYEKTAAPSALQRSPSLADPDEIARTVDELSGQVRLSRQLAPMCFVVADAPSVSRGAMPIDYSFAPADVEGFVSFLQNRLADPDSAAARWTPSAADASSLRPMTARETKAALLKSPTAPLDFPLWALHREYMDASLAALLQRLSNAAVTAARSADDDFNWGMMFPVSAVSDLSGPSAYGGFDYELLPSCADVLILSADAPAWSWRLARDLARRGKVIVRVDAAAVDAASAVWRAVQSGSAGVIIANSPRLFGPAAAPAPLALPASGADLAATLAEISSGLADLLAASVSDAPLALVYSSAAVRAGWMLDYLAAEGAPPAHPQAGLGALAAWPRILTDLGIDFEWVSLAEVSRGVLSSQRYPVAVLPETWCVDDMTAGAMAQYVEDGGTLIADNAAGMLDGEYSSTVIRPMDELFGIRRRPLSFERARALAPGSSREPARSLTADDALVVVNPAAASFTAKSAAPSSGPAPRTGVLNPRGRGGTVYLNLFVEPYLTGDKLRKAAVRLAVSDALAAGLLRTSTFLLQDDVPLDAAVSTRVIASTRIIFIQPAEIPDKAKPLEIRLPLAADYYNLRPSDNAGEYLGNNSTFFIPPPASGPVVLSLQPFPLLGMPLDLEYSANAIMVRTTLEARRDVGDRLFRLEVYSPSGEHLCWFDRTVTAPRGSFNGVIDLPQNAPPGTWRVLVRDLMSGMASWSDVDVD